MTGLIRVLTAAMGLLFVAALVLQLNDPDPFGWIIIYGAAAIACGKALRGRLSRELPALVGIAALAWAGTLAARLEWAALGGMFEAFEMQSIEVEEAREAVGLVIVAAWMGVLVWTPDAAGSKARGPRP